MLLGVRGLGFTVIPGITQLTPDYIGKSASIRGGMNFGLGGLHGLGDWSDLSVAELEALANAATNAFTKGVALWNTQQVINLNLALAEKNLPPVSLGIAAPTVNFEIAGIPGPMFLAGIALVVYLLARK